MATRAEQDLWMQQWRDAWAALRDVRRRELQSLTPEAALRASDALLQLSTTVPLPAERLRSSGLVEQQKWLHRSGR